MMQTEWRPESLRLAQEIRKHAEAKGITAGQFAVSWVLNSSFVSAVIAGPRTEEHWDEVVATELKGVFTCTKAAAAQMVER